MEDALMVLCWLSIYGPLLDSCRQVCRQSAGGGPLMEGILGCHAHMLLYTSGVNYNVNGNYTKYFAPLCCRFFFAFWEITAANLRLL